MLCAKFCSNWPSRFGEEDFYLPKTFFAISVFEKDVVPHFFKLESFFLRMLCGKFGLNWSSGL